MPALRVCKRVHLIDYDGADLSEPACLAGPEQVVDALISANPDRVRSRWRLLLPLFMHYPAHPDLQHRCDPKLAVTLSKVVFLLVCKRNQRNDEEEVPPPFHEVLYPCKFTDQRLSCRGL